MNKVSAVHPGMRSIRDAGPEPGKRKSCSLILPSFSGEDGIGVSTVAVKSLMRIASVDGEVRPKQAGSLAKAIRHYPKNKSLTDIRGISDDSAETLMDWFSSYEQACVDFGNPEAAPADEEKSEAENPAEEDQMSAHLKRMAKTRQAKHGSLEALSSLYSSRKLISEEGCLSALPELEEVIMKLEAWINK